MLSYQDIAIAENWIHQYQDFQKLISRIQRDLTDYQAKPGASQIRISILTETVTRMKQFGEATKQLIDAQKSILEENSGMYLKHKKLLEDHRIMKAYGASKGCELDLLQFLTLKDFSL